MGSTTETARKTLADAEVRLRELIGEAARSGDYETVRSLSTVAERLLALCSLLSTSAEVKSGGGHPPGGVVPKRSPRGGFRLRAIKGEYPRYVQRSGSLLRIGWSKKSREEYVHKVPQDSYGHIVRSLLSLAREGSSLITVEQVMKRMSSLDGPEVPAYQVYATLGLLSRDEYVERLGREGYRVAAPTAILEQSQQAWNSLPESD